MPSYAFSLFAAYMAAFFSCLIRQKTISFYSVLIFDPPAGLQKRVSF